MNKLAITAMALAACTGFYACGGEDNGGGGTIAPDAGPPETSTPRADGSIIEDAGPVTGDTGTDAKEGGGAAVIGAGPYAIAYSVAPGVGIDQRPTVAAVVTVAGELDGYTASVDEAPTRGTNQDGEHYVDAFSQIGRWNGGTTGGKYYVAAPFPFTATQGFHHAMVVVPTSLPTSGTVSYTLAKATAVTNEDGSSQLGTLAATGAIAFSGTTRKTGLELTITVPGDATYTATTTGGTADPTQSALGQFGVNNINRDLAVTGNGAACGGGAACSMNVRAFVGGGANGAARVVVSFVLGSGGATKSLRGAFVLKAP